MYRHGFLALALILGSISIGCYATTPPSDSHKLANSFDHLYKDHDKAYEAVCDRLPIEEPPQWKVWGATIGSHMYTTYLLIHSWCNQAHRWLVIKWHALTLSLNRLTQSKSSQKGATDRAPTAHT